MSGVADAYHCTATRDSKLICVRQALRAKLVRETPAHLQGGREVAVAMGVVGLRSASP